MHAHVCTCKKRTEYIFYHSVLFHTHTHNTLQYYMSGINATGSVERPSSGVSSMSSSLSSRGALEQGHTVCVCVTITSYLHV